jgi:hypothetical protein
LQTNQLATTTQPRAATWNSLVRVGFRHAGGMVVRCSPGRRFICLAAAQDGRVYASRNPAAGARSWKFTVRTGSDLPAAACPSATECLLETDSGGLLVSKDPAGGPRAWKRPSLRGVGSFNPIACPSISWCIAFREGENAARTQPIAVAYIVTRPLSSSPAAWLKRYTLPGWMASLRTSLSCPNASLCVDIPAGHGTLAFSTRPQDPHSWHQTRLPIQNPGLALFGTEADPGVACPSANLCLAAAQDGEVFTTTRPTAAASAWHHSSLTFGPSGGAVTGGPACPSVSLCILAGASDGRGVIWTTANPAAPAPTWTMHVG